MNLRYLILNTDYPEFLRWLYAQHPRLVEQPYDEQMRVRNESLFGVADFYSSNLRKLGNEAWDIHVNNEFMQKAWAREHGIPAEEPTTAGHLIRRAAHRAQRIAARTPLRRLVSVLQPLLGSLTNQARWFYDILSAQIKHYQPDVLLNQAMDRISGRFLREMKPYVRLLVGQVASPFLNEDSSCYDLILSSLPNFVDHFRRMGLAAELHSLGFEPRILSGLSDGGAKIPVSFVGSLSGHHAARSRLLAYLCARLEVKLWGHGVENLPKNSPIRRCYMGEAWGIGMYQILYNSRITLNHHIDVAGSYANNMRLFEATGAGTLLITDWKVNLHEMFEPGKELVAYRNPQECVELIQHYLNRDDEREAIASAGQQRTLRDHTYYNRMQELEDIILRHSSKSSPRSRGRM